MRLEFVWCGSREPHHAHEWLKGARRMDCPGFRVELAKKQVVDQFARDNDGA